MKLPGFPQLLYIQADNCFCLEVIYFKHMHGDKQNRQQEVFNREALHLCKGSWRSKIW